MPELPEVESIKNGLLKGIKNSKILEVKILNQKIISSNGTKRKIDKNKTEEFLNNIKNKNIKTLKRFAKNIIIELSDKSVLIIHLKMTGQLVFLNKKNQKTIGGHPIIESYKENLPNKHTCLIFKLNNGELFYNDVRQFGYVLYYKNIMEAKNKGHLKNIGLDPFDKNFTLKYFSENIFKKRKNLKQVFLEQSIVHGCGNIYSDEICFASHVSPFRICNKLKDIEIKNLYKNIKSILSIAIKMGGSSVNNYLLADGSRGNFAKKHKVYGRGGEKCLNCKNILTKEFLNGRTTVYCSNCQK